MRQADEVSQRVLWNLLRKGSQPHEKSRNRRLGGHGCRHRTDAACPRLCSACVRSAAGRGGGGYGVVGWDVGWGGAPALAARGGVPCTTPAEVAAACAVVVSVVVDAAQTESVLFGAGGAAAAMKPGSTFVMCSTVD